MFDVFGIGINTAGSVAIERIYTTRVLTKKRLGHGLEKAKVR
jgi:hypothetical protein